jgi:pimeloyl-ACP methyl ester carboxylesterase
LNLLSFPEVSITVAVLDVPGTDSSATPRVFLHGLGSSAIDIFPEIIDRPSMHSARSVLIDLPGFGHSTSPENWSFSMEDQATIVARVIDALGLAQIDIIGHSMGGSISIALTSRRPNLVHRLIVAEPNLDPGVGDLSVHIARQTQIGFTNRGFDTLVAQIRRQATRGDLLATRFLETVIRTTPAALHRSSVSLMAARDPTFREQFESLSMPRATITGDRTPPLDPPLADPEEIVHYIVEDAGHVMMLDNPNGFANAIDRTLRT